MPNTKIMTFVGYSDLFSYIKKGTLLVPKSYLEKDDNIDGLINNIIDNFYTPEAISYSSFLNTIVQTHEPNDTQQIGWNELRQCKLVDNDNKAGIVFHRDNLLYMIAQLIRKEKIGNVKITGQKTINSAADYYKTLLLISDKRAFKPPESLSKQFFIRDYFLRAYPYYYLPDIVEKIYKMRFQRYGYIYTDLISKLNSIQKDRVDKVSEGVELITKEFNLSLKEYFHVLTGIFNWFLIVPNAKRENSENEKLKTWGFDPKNIESYYIRKKNFGEDSDLFVLVRKLSHILNDFKQKLQTVRRDPIKGFYRDFQAFFDYPIFKIDDESYCIIDLKFLLEGMCAGFIWRINEISPKNLQEIRAQYGYLLEEYFVGLLKKIFGDSSVTRPCGNGEPDAILETDSHIFIFEFTIEYYRFASLYNESLDLLQEDVYRLLFNEGKDDKASRGKKDKGKFYKLNNYLQKHANSSKKVVPILVTENYFGDYEMLDELDGQISKKINNKNLTQLIEHKPLILNMDDLEFFWRVSNSAYAAEQFSVFVNNWQQLKDKGPYSYNFLYFMSENHQEEEINNNSSGFFNWNEFVNKFS